MEAARDLLLELGDQSKLSVRAVTTRAGVSPNALYIHFASKDELLDAVMNASYKEWRAVLNGGIPADADAIDQLRAYCHGYFQFAHERSGIFRVVFMTTIREGVPVPVRGGPVGEDEGVDSFNDFLAIVTRCLAENADAFTQAAYLGPASTDESHSARPSPPSPGHPQTNTSSGSSKSTSPTRPTNPYGLDSPVGLEPERQPARGDYPLAGSAVFYIMAVHRRLAHSIANLAIRRVDQLQVRHQTSEVNNRVQPTPGFQQQLAESACS